MRLVGYYYTVVKELCTKPTENSGQELLFNKKCNYGGAYGKIMLNRLMIRWETLPLGQRKARISIYTARYYNFAKMFKAICSLNNFWWLLRLSALHQYSFLDAVPSRQVDEDPGKLTDQILPPSHISINR